MRPRRLRVKWVGAALMAWRGEPAGWTVRVAQALPAEPHRTPIVVDAGAVPDGDWPQLADLLAGLPAERRTRLRLVLPWAGCSADTAPARIVSDRLGADVIAPDGCVLATTPGMLYVGRPQGGGGWRQFIPGLAPALVSIRYPTPEWEGYLPLDEWQSATGIVAESVPAGLWVHGTHDVRAADRLDDPVFALPTDPYRVALILGGPSGGAVDRAKFGEVIQALPRPVLDRAVVLRYATLAERSASVAPLVTVPEPAPPEPPEPDEPDERRLARMLARARPIPAGQFAASDVEQDASPYRRLPAYLDRYAVVVGPELSGDPVRAERLTVADLAALLDASPDRAGRPPLLIGMSEGAAGTVRRTAERLGAPVLATLGPAFVSPDGIVLTERAVHRYSPDDGGASPTAVRLPGVRVVHLGRRLVRGRYAVAPAAHGAGRPVPPAASGCPPARSASAVAVLERPVVTVPASPPKPERRPAAAPTRPVWTPSPHRITAARRSTDEERAAARAALAGRYDVHARRVTRALASRPGMRVGGADTDRGVLTDLAAVRAYASGDISNLDRVLRSPNPTTVVAMAACVASGLRRLPSYRGIVHRPVAPAELGTCRAPAVLTEPAFVTTVTGANVTAPAFLIWSYTGRRTGSLEFDGRSEEVVFAPNTSFTVLARNDTTVLLRELLAHGGGAEPGGLDEDDKATLVLLERALSESGTGRRADAPLEDRYAFPVGHDDSGRPFTPPTSQ